MVGLALMLFVCALEVRGGGDGDYSGSENLLALGFQEAFRKRRLAYLQGPNGHRVSEQEKKELRFPTRPLPRLEQSLPTWTTKILRKVGKLPGILRSLHGTIREADAKLVRSHLAGITSRGAFNALPEALSVHDFLASAVQRVKHGNQDIPPTVNPAKDATASTTDDSMHVAPETTAVKHGAGSIDRPPKKDAGETFVPSIATVDNLANVMLVTPDGVRNEWDDIVDEVINSIPLWDNDGDAVATGPTSSPIPGRSAPRTSSAVPTYPPSEFGNTGCANGNYDHGDEAAACETLERRSTVSVRDDGSWYSQPESFGSSISMVGSSDDSDFEEVPDDSDDCSSYSTAVTVDRGLSLTGWDAKSEAMLLDAPEEVALAGGQAHDDHQAGLLSEVESTTSLRLRTFDRTVRRSGGGGRPRVSWGSVSGGRSSVSDWRMSFDDSDGEGNDDGEARRAMAALREFRREMAAEQQGEEEGNATESRAPLSSSVPMSSAPPTLGRGRSPRSPVSHNRRARSRSSHRSSGGSGRRVTPPRSNSPPPSVRSRPRDTDTIKQTQQVSPQLSSPPSPHVMDVSDSAAASRVSMSHMCQPFTPDAGPRGIDARERVGVSVVDTDDTTSEGCSGYNGGESLVEGTTRECMSWHDQTTYPTKSPSKLSREGLLLDEDGSEVDGGCGDEAHSTEVNGHRMSFVEEVMRRREADQQAARDLEVEKARQACGGLLPHRSLGNAWDKRRMTVAATSSLPDASTSTYTQRGHRTATAEIEMCRQWPAAVVPRAVSLIAGLETLPEHDRRDVEVEFEHSVRRGLTGRSR